MQHEVFHKLPQTFAEMAYNILFPFWNNFDNSSPGKQPSLPASYDVPVYISLNLQEYFKKQVEMAAFPLNPTLRYPLKNNQQTRQNNPQEF